MRNSTDTDTDTATDTNARLETTMDADTTATTSTNTQNVTHRPSRRAITAIVLTAGLVIGGLALTDDDSSDAEIEVAWGSTWS
jgi:glycerol uptake facilitator-like aquaporin